MSFLSRSCWDVILIYIGKVGCFFGRRGVLYGGYRSCVIILLFVLLLWGMTTQNRLARISALCLCHERAGFTVLTATPNVPTLTVLIWVPSFLPPSCALWSSAVQDGLVVGVCSWCCFCNQALGALWVLCQGRTPAVRSGGEQVFTKSFKQCLVCPFPPPGASLWALLFRSGTWLSRLAAITSHLHLCGGGVGHGWRQTVLRFTSIS